jgi:hypothetical protein
MMNKYGLALFGCTLGLAGCSQQRVPEDWQLSALLKRADATPSGTDAIDAQAVGCLRAWSGDAELAKGLSVLVAGEDGRKRCRDRLDGWLADATRNPAKFTFDEVSTPAVARRAMNLLESGRTAVPEPGNSEIPSALRKPPPIAKPRPADPSVDLGAAGAELAEAEDLCRQAAQAAAAPDASSAVRRFAPYCSQSLSRLRASMEALSKKGGTPAQLEGYASNARNLARTAREILAAPPK